jgi:uncharacterized cupin superfamily protein
VANPKVLWKASELREGERPYAQRLNPSSHFMGTPMSRRAGLQRANVSMVRLPPGKESFAYHAHLLEEEWAFILSGAGVAEIDGAEHEVGPGDFLGFAAPNVPHLLRNRSAEDLVYLMGGESHPLDVVEFPHLGKRCVLVSTPEGTVFHELGPGSKPFGRSS